MKKVIQKLDITQEQYESIIWNFYSNWCASVTISLKEFQQVLASAPINAWFRMELTKREIEFNELTDRYSDPNVTPQDFEKCYHKCLFSLFNIRPTALLNQIKKTKTPSAGIKVFTATSN